MSAAFPYIILLAFTIPYSSFLRDCYISVQNDIDKIKNLTGKENDSSPNIISLMTGILLKITLTLYPYIILIPVAFFGNPFLAVLVTIIQFTIQVEIIGRIRGEKLNLVNRNVSTLWPDEEKRESNDDISDNHKTNINESYSFKDSHINWRHIDGFMVAHGRGLMLDVRLSAQYPAAINYQKKIIIVNPNEFPESFTTKDVIALIGHEIMHYRLKDRNQVVFTFTRHLPILLIATILFIVLLADSIPMPEIVAVGIATLLFIVFVLSICFYAFILKTKKRLEPQIIELKCDRYSCDFPGVIEISNGEVVNHMHAALLKLKIKEDEQYKILARLGASNNIVTKADRGIKGISGFLRGYIQLQEHPSINYRIEVLKNYKKWHFTEYYIHALVVINWIITGKGWTGK